MTTDSHNNPRDDEVLAQLYKKGAKETPPAKLNYEIINYAANPDKSATTPSQVGSHFGGGWKVPLSMAASVVVVFALLVQLDQSPQDLELPPIPELSTPSEQESKDNALKSQPQATEESEKLFEAEESYADDAPSFENDRKESDLDSQDTGALIIDKPAQTKDKLDKKPEQKLEASRERDRLQQALEKSKPVDEVRMQNNEPATTPASPASKPAAKSKSDGSYAPKLAKPQATKKQMQVPEKEVLNGDASKAASGAVMQERSISEESIIRDDNQNSADMAADTELGDAEVQNESQVKGEFVPIPVENWLLMIEKLVAQKDYAEAARQLGKFKQAHPKVNVEDLEAKIP